jgi:hypothetical protein
MPQGSAPLPQDDGERIGVIHISEDEEIRISWCTYNDRPYVNIRTCTRKNGSWWPEPRKGLTIRIRELPELAEVVAALLDRAEKYHKEHREPRNYPEPKRRWGHGDQALPEPETRFDEFTGGQP